MGVFLLCMTIALVGVSVAGCGKSEKPAQPVANPQPEGKPQATSKLIAENYLKIKEGMPVDDVVLILGNPSTIKEFGDQVHRIWEEGDKSVYIVSELGTVKSKRQLGLK